MAVRDQDLTEKMKIEPSPSLPIYCGYQLLYITFKVEDIMQNCQCNCLNDLAICFRRRSLDTRETSTAGSKCHTGMGDKEWLQVCSPQVQSHTFHCTTVSGPETPIVKIGNTLLPVEESTKFLGLWWDSHLLFKKHISVLKTQCKEALNLIRVVAHLKWGGDRDTLLMLYRAIVHSKFDYGCIVYGTASNTNLRQLDSVHNSGLRLASGAFCTSPVSSLYTETNEAPLEERRLKLSMHYYIKLVTALTVRHIMPCMNSTEPSEIYMLQGQIEEEAWPDPRPLPLVSK